jgi:streptomycin 6-kinase
VELIKVLQKRPLLDQSRYQTLHSHLEPLLSSAEAGMDRFKTVALWLLSTMKDPVLLHCDLHPHNILLRGEEKWVAIDPRGIVGEVACEAPPFICCYQLPRALSKDAWNQMIQNRLALFAKLLRVNKRRLQAWVAVYAAHRACNEQAQDWLEVAQKLGTF